MKLDWSCHRYMHVLVTIYSFGEKPYYMYHRPLCINVNIFYMCVSHLASLYWHYMYMCMCAHPVHSLHHQTNLFSCQSFIAWQVSQWWHTSLFSHYMNVGCTCIDVYLPPHPHVQSIIDQLPPRPGLHVSTF